MSRNNTDLPTHAPAAQRGVGIVAVLSVLTVLALLAALMAVTVQVELTSANITSHRAKADYLLDSCVEHVRAELASPSLASSVDPVKQWPMLVQQFGDEKSGQPVWFNVRDSSDTLVGRYCIRIEDEAGKASLNAACRTTPSPGNGWNPSEINLVQALGMPERAVQRVVNFRYGANGVPGATGDDDRNNVVLMADGIDNNANGVVDEDGEGIDDPGEYNPRNLYGDDRKFTYIGEAASLLFTGAMDPSIMQRQATRRAFLQRATLYSEDLPGSPTLPDTEPADLNCMNARESRRRIDLANQTEPFEPIALRRTQLALNIVDYRDQNHVLSTMGSTYGVEAVCFNEILAHDASTSYLLQDSCTTEETIYNWLDQNNALELKSGEDYWKKFYGIEESSKGNPKRAIIAPMFAYMNSFDQREYLVSAAYGWRLKNGIPGHAFSPNGSFTLPDAPGENGITPIFQSHGVLAHLPGHKTYRYGERNPPGDGTSWDDYTECWNGGVSPVSLYRTMMDVMGKRGLVLNNHAKFPENFFKNSRATFYKWGEPQTPIGQFEVISSSPNHQFSIRPREEYTKESFADRMNSKGMSNENYDLSVTFDGWGMSHWNCAWPGTTAMIMMRPRVLKPGTYFKVIVTSSGREVFIGARPHENVRSLGVDKNVPAGNYTDYTSKIWACNDGDPIRTDRAGWLSAFYSAPANVSRRRDVLASVDYMRLIAPEVAEMYNASRQPISLANWRVICNTGTLPTEVGRIKRTSYYDSIARKPMTDDNPCVMPGGYFYLVNDTKLFDARYGNADFNWGSTPDEKMPVFQMDQQNWGVTYRFNSIKGSEGAFTVNIANEKFERDMFKFETIQIFFDGEDVNEPDARSGRIFPITRGNGATTLSLFGSLMRGWVSWGEDDITVKKEGSVMILGLPYRGGIVSLTLKDQYEQVCARTIDYGTLKQEEQGYSAEKSDPTKYAWSKQQMPTIGGTERKAKNRALSNRATTPSSVKNAAYGSVGELRNVSTSVEFETLGGTGSKSRRMLTMTALANTFCASAIRLEAVDPMAVRTGGWKDAVDAVDSTGITSVRARNARWEPDQWKGQILRFTSGTLRNQLFPVFGNSPNSLILAEKDTKTKPLSAPGRLVLNPRPGDTFSLGPGYITACAYSRKSNQQGEWHWKQRVPVRGKYNLYVYGLSDAVITTEFLEENNNASLDIDVWNWDTGTYDTLCRREQYRKEDCISVGTIQPAHVSKSGDFKIRITPHDVEEVKQVNTSVKTVSANRRTGFAWFNFAMLSPAPIAGRVNVNTASAKLLSSLPGVTSNLAANIAAGIDSAGRPKLKPYSGPGSLLSVAGMNLDIFERVANLVCVNGDAFTIEAEVQVVADLNRDGVFDESKGDKVLAQRRRRSVVVRTPGSVPSQYQVAERHDP